MRSLFLIPAFLLASSAFGQQVTLRGKVEDFGAGQFHVDCTNVELVSSAFNLNAFVSEQVLIVGNRVGSGALVDVTSITIVPEIFEIPGNPEVGDTVRFGATHTPGSQVFFRAALAPGFVPVGGIGTYFLDPAGDLQATSGIIGAQGNLELAVPMPNNPALIGRTVYGQAIVRTGSTFLLSNPDCKDIR